MDNFALLDPLATVCYSLDCILCRGKQDKYKDVPGFCRPAKTTEVAEHGYVLTPGRYVGAEAVEDDDEPFDDKMKRLTGTLYEQFDAIRQLMVPPPAPKRRAVDFHSREVGIRHGVLSVTDVLVPAIANRSVKSRAPSRRGEARGAKKCRGKLRIAGVPNSTLSPDPSCCYA